MKAFQAVRLASRVTLPRALLPPDAISEFKVTTTGLPAEYGHTGAAVGSFTIKSGKNDLHGSIYEYFRNSAMDANNWLAKHNNSRITSSKLNEFGVTIGGPVVLPHLYDGHDKTFFFFFVWRLQTRRTELLHADADSDPGSKARKVYVHRKCSCQRRVVRPGNNTQLRHNLFA